MRKYQDCLLDPEQCAIAFIDHQPQMYLGSSSSNRTNVINNVVGLAKVAKVFNVPCILTTIATKAFSGYLMSKLQKVFPDIKPIDRTIINSWEDENFKKAIKNTGKKKILLSGLWTEACVTYPTLSMIHDGYEIYVVADCCAGSSVETHDFAIRRMLSAGAIPVTWEQVMKEFQRDWANKSTYDDVMAIAKKHCGAYGLAIEYKETMLEKKLPQQLSDL